MPIKDFEIGETHLETELVLDMLSNFDDKSYVKNKWDAALTEESKKDWGHSPDENHCIMALFNTIMISQGFIKFLFYLRIFENFSK